MAKLFPIISKPRQIVGGGSGGEVTAHRLQYDLPEQAPVPNDIAGLVMIDDVNLASPEEDSGVGLLVRCEISVPDPTEDSGVNVKVFDTIAAPDALDIGAIVAQISDTHPVPNDEVHVAITLASNADNIVSATGWQNQTSVLGETTQQAFLAASSSGLAGTSSNTRSGTLEISMPPLNLDWLSIVSARLVSHHSSGVSGLPLLGGSYNVDFQYDLGAGWVTYAPIRSANVGALERSYDLTAIANGSWAGLSNLKLQGTGAITSGTGIGVQRSVFWRYVRLEVSAARTL